MSVIYKKQSTARAGCRNELGFRNAEIAFRGARSVHRSDSKTQVSNLCVRHLVAGKSSVYTKQGLKEWFANMCVWF